MTHEEFAEAFRYAYETLTPRFVDTAQLAPSKEWTDIPLRQKAHIIATAMMVCDAVHRVTQDRELTTLSHVKDGDVIIVRYIGEMPDSDARKNDYAAIHDYFHQSGVTVSLLGISDVMRIDKASEFEMAQFGWYRRGANR